MGRMSTTGKKVTWDKAMRSKEDLTPGTWRSRWPDRAADCRSGQDASSLIRRLSNKQAVKPDGLVGLCAR